MSEIEKEKSTLSKQKRIEYLDIARGIGLLLVAWAHSRGPYYYRIYLFHMPFFVLLSGYLHKSETEIIPFIKKRLLSLYVPFVFWNILSSFIRYCGGILKGKSLLKLILKILLTLEKDGTLLGASWFLPALFLISVSYKLAERLLFKVPCCDILLSVIYLAVATFGFAVTLPFMLSRTLILSFFYSIGALLRKRNIDLRKWFTIRGIIVSAICFLALLPGNSANMGANQYSAPIGFILTSFLGSYIIFWVSGKLEAAEAQPFRAIRQFDIFIGKWAIYIILFTFIGAYVVNILLNLPLDVPLFVFIKENSAVGDSSGYIWLIYFIASVFIPIVIGYILNLGLVGKILRGIHAVPDIRKR